MSKPLCLLRLLGAPSLSRLDTGAQLNFRYRKAWALMGNLVVQPERWIPRAALAARLWPQLPDAAKLTNLRQIVAAVTQALQSWDLHGVLEADRYHLRWQTHAQLLVDLQWLQQAQGEPDPASWPGPEAPETHWLAPFLDGLAAEPQPHGADWLSAERQRWRALGSAALMHLGRQRAAEGRGPAAIAAVRAVWEQDRLHEEAGACLIQWLQAQGDARGAHEIWALADNHWRSELGLPAPASLRAALQEPASLPGAASLVAAPLAPAASAPARERRWVAVLHLQWQLRGPPLPEEDWDALQVQWLEQARQVLQARQGQIMAATGLQIDACFGVGADPEPAAEQAVLAALSLLKDSPSALAGRAAVVSGLTLLAAGPLGLSLPGRLPQAAQALAGLAGDGMVWACAATANQLRRRFALAPQPSAVLPPGLKGPAEHVLRRHPEDQQALPQATLLLGRQAELAQLRQAWAQAQAGQPSWWLLTGPAGIGKTTLATYFANAVAAAGGRVLRRPCSLALQQQPFGPLRQDLAADPDTDWQRPRWLDAAFSWLDAQCQDQPALLVLDDVHWADEGTRECLARYGAGLAGQQLMLLCTTRPERPLPLEGGTPHTLTLQALGHGDTMALIRARAMGLPTPEVDALARRSGGVPLFAERLALRPTPLDDAPDTPLPYMLQAELDRLGQQRHVLQAAAVLGQHFDARDLQELLPQVELAPVLAQAQALQLLNPSGPSPERHAFRHALIREAALHSLPPASRRQLHLQQAERLRARPHVRPAELAVHLEGAEQWAAASAAWQQAGEAALALEFAQDATQHFERALHALGESCGPDAALVNAQSQRLALRLAQATMMSEGYGSPSAFARFGEIVRALAPHGVPAPEMRALHFQALSGVYMGAGSQGLRMGLDQAQQLLAQADNPAEQLMAHFAMGNSLFWHGKLDAALHHQQQAAKWAQDLPAPQRRAFGEDDPAVMNQAVQAWNLWFLGRADEALALAEDAVLQARQAGRAHALCFSLSLAAGVRWCVDDAAGTLCHAQEAWTLAHRFGFPLWLGVNTLYTLWAQAKLGHAAARAQGLRAAQQMRQAYRAGSTTSRWILASTLVVAGEYREAEQQLQQALADARAGLDQFCEPELLRLLALCRGQLGHGSASIVALLEQAADIARAMPSPGQLQRILADLRQQGMDAAFTRT